jgi:hypothetical protein
MATKAKRVLKNITFDHDKAHLALCSKEQGVANNADYALVLKSRNFSDEFIQKMQQVKVTMELPDFLSKFFYLWEEDAKVLATMMGYVEPADTAQMEADEAQQELQDWIESRMSAFEIIKSAYDKNDMQVFASLDEDSYLAVLQDQELLEKAILAVEKQKQEQKQGTKTKVKKSTKTTTKVAEEDTSIASEVTNVVEESASNQTNVEKSKMDEELIEVQKSLTETQELLKAAQAQVAQFQAEKKAAVEKARKQEVVTAVKDEAKAEILFKAVKDATDEDFVAVVKALAEMATAIEKSNLFSEQGGSVENEEPVVQESLVARAIKQQQSK